MDFITLEVLFFDDNYCWFNLYVQFVISLILTKIIAPDKLHFNANMNKFFIYFLSTSSIINEYPSQPKTLQHQLKIYILTLMLCSWETLHLCLDWVCLLSTVLLDLMIHILLLQWALLAEIFQVILLCLNYDQFIIIKQ